MKRLMTTAEVANYLDFKKKTIWIWARNGQIPCSRIGGQFRFDQNKIDKWVKKQEMPV